MVRSKIKLFLFYQLNLIHFNQKYANNNTHLVDGIKPTLLLLLLFRRGKIIKQIKKLLIELSRYKNSLESFNFKAWLMFISTFIIL